MSRRKTRGKRRFLVWGIALTALIVIILIYETNKELQRVKTDAGAAEEYSPSAPVTLEKARAIIAGYYRSHDFPTGWKLGEIDIAAPDRLEMTLYFSPRIGDSRHGGPAPPGAIDAANACPLDAGVSRQIARYALWIRVNDKTGLIDHFACK